MIKACIFDMDGTTVNTIDSIAYFANGALKHYGLSEIETEKYKVLVGNGARVLVERMFDCVNGDMALFDKVFKLYNESYDNDFLYLTRPYDGILELLKSLKEKNIKTAILSNKPHRTAVKVCDALFGKDLVDLCCGGREGIKLKPDPEAVLMMLEELDIKKEECLYIGDTAVDINTAKNAGLTSIGVLWGFRDRAELMQAGADFIAETPNQILDIVNDKTEF